MSRLWMVALMSVAILLLAGGLHAGTPAPQRAAGVDLFQAARLPQRQFMDQHGLPQNSIHCMARDATGRLWVGTENGIASYNGREWIPLRMPEGVPTRLVRAVATLPDGSLSFGTEGAGVLNWKDGRWRIMGPAEGLPHPNVRTLLHQAKTLWAGTDGGLARLEGDRFSPVPMPPPLAGASVRALLATTETSGKTALWVGTLRGLGRLEEGRWTVFGQAEGLPSGQIHALHAFPTEGHTTIWAGTSRGVACLEGEAWKRYGLREGLPTERIHAFATTRDAEGPPRLWAGTYGNGLATFRHGRWMPYGTGAESRKWLVHSLFTTEAANGTSALWVGSGGKGLIRLEFGKWMSLGPGEGLRGEVVIGIAEAPEGMYFATVDGGLSRLGDDGRLREIPIPVRNPISLASGTSGIWVGTLQGEVLHQQGTSLKVYGSKEGLPSLPIADLCEGRDPEGRPLLWAAVWGGGLGRFDGSRWRMVTTTEGLPGNGVRTMASSASAPRPTLFVGTASGLALVEWREGQWRAGPGPSSLRGIVINHALETREAGHPYLWVGTRDQGLFRLDLMAPEARPLHFGMATTPALPSDLVYRVVQDRKGRIYATTSRGVFRLSPHAGRSVPAEAAYQGEWLTTDEGLPSNECNAGASMVDGRGRIWVGTVAGAAVLDPSEARSYPLPPTLVLEQCLLNGRPATAANLQSLRHRDNSLTFQFALLCTVSEEGVRYQTQLEGLERGPSPWTRDPRREYPALPPGRYTFKVYARDHAGNLSTPLVLAIRIFPPPWATWWAYASYVLGTGGLLFLVVRARLRNLHQQNLLLEAKVHERTQALEASEHRAQEASMAKSAFLAGMSHELRTPLNAILGYAQLMGRDPGRNSKDRLHTDMILRAGEHLLGLINDVLSVSRIEASQLTLHVQPFESLRLVRGVEEMIRVRARSKGLSFDVEVDSELPPALEGDEGKLRQVLLNLLGNAVKFTEDGGLVLRVRWLAGNQAYFEVADMGPGIAPSDIPDLFGPFKQTETGLKASEGAGLGLYLSQAMVRLMGGEIQVESEVGRGTRFHFKVPLKSCEFTEERPPARRVLKLADGQPPLRQLVVDDKEDNRELLVELLGSVGFPVQCASDGLEALDRWKAWHPDVVWMDIRMPGMNGFQTTQAIRTLESEGGLPRTTILALTASVFEHDHEAVMDAGCDGMLTKPYRERELFDMLSRHCGLSFQEEGPEAPATPSNEDLQALPREWREAFRQALDLGDTVKARHLVDGLPPGEAAIAARLRQSLEAFQLDDLIRIFRT